ncbi:MAG TPA: hypothetical protein VGQ19_21055 [Burkholderiales bacterium]|nr:hypothetical protein [Burkholderiales bacterium]
MSARHISQKLNGDKNLNQARLKRLAIQIVGQLPDDPDEAMQVLQYCGEFVQKFLVVEPEEISPGSAVVPLRG